MHALACCSGDPAARGRALPASPCCSAIRGRARCSWRSRECLYVPDDGEPPDNAVVADIGEGLPLTPDEELVALMSAVRRATCARGGDLSAWRCGAAVQALAKAIRSRSGLEARLGHGKCRGVAGDFVGGSVASLQALHASALGTMTPSEYTGQGLAHSYLRFEDGSIADCTADQFDSKLPRCWWPADASRYTDRIVVC